LLGFENKIPNFLLKLLVSVGDYKHSDPSRLSNSYEKSYSAFTNLLKYVERIDLLKTCSDSVQISHFLYFCGICFPHEKVLAVARFNCISNEIEMKKIMEEREATSVKKLKIQIQKNPMFKVLIQFSFELLKNNSQFPKSLSLLEGLVKL